MRRSPQLLLVALVVPLLLGCPRGDQRPPQKRRDKHRPVPPAAPEKAPKAVFFHADFEQPTDIGDFDLSWLHNRWAAKTVSKVGARSAKARGGRGALEISLRREDEMASKGKRAELAVPFSYRRGREYWFGFSVYLPASWREDNKGDVVAQWFAHEDRHLGEKGRSPALALRLRKAFWYVTYRWDGRPVTPGNSAPKGKIFKGRYRRGVWTDWVFRIRFSYDEAAKGAQQGLVEVYKNGKKVAQRRGPNTYNDRAGPTLKLGIYKAPWNNPRAKSATCTRKGGAEGDVVEGACKERIRKRLLYLDEVRVGDHRAGYAGVAPRPRRAASATRPTSNPTSTPTSRAR